jgi:ribonucleoside-diphosphate reductase alpha chain
VTVVTDVDRRPYAVEGLTECIHTECGNMYITVNWWAESKNNGGSKSSERSGEREQKAVELPQVPRVREVFFRMGKCGNCERSWAAAVGTLASLSLRVGVDVEVVIKALEGNRCDKVTFGNGGGRPVVSCADAVARVLRAASDRLKEQAVKEKAV